MTGPESLAAESIAVESIAGESVVADRLQAFAEAVKLAGPYLGDQQLEPMQATIERSRSRLRHGTHHTVVALAGPTGAGKSSLFNALIGETVSTVGVRRPTTGSAHACVFGDSDSSSALLDWMAVGQRFHRPGHIAGQDLDGLILIDLPDHDSTAEANRMEVDRMVELVDLLIWVVDPQKYADHALHEGYLRPLASHAAIMRFVLSKTDTLSEEDRCRCVADFTGLLERGGIAEPSVFSVSVVGPEGVTNPSVNAVRGELAAVLAHQRAVVERIEADLGSAAEQLLAYGFAGDAERSTGGRSADKKYDQELIERLGKAAGVQTAAKMVSAQHRHEAHLAMGWPVTRWLARFRRRPIADLPVARKSAVADAEVGIALRMAAEHHANGLGAPWASALRRTAESQQNEVLAALDLVSARTIQTHRKRPRWWAVFGVAQRAVLLVAALALGWLVALAMIDGFFRVDIDFTVPQIGDVPLPTLVLVLAVVVGVVLSVVARLAAAIGANRRASAVRADLEAGVAAVAAESIDSPLRDVVRDTDRIRELAKVACGE